MQNDPRIVASIEQLTRATTRMVEQVLALAAEAAAARPADGGWSPAQIAYHVGLTSDSLFVPTFAGTAPFLEKTPADFVETFSFATLPDRVKTFPTLEPPAGVSAADGVRRLREGNAALADAMRSMPEERLSLCARLPFGTLSIQQMAEFGAGHVLRHQAQLDRTVRS
jgi:hypothetical protein